MIISFFLSLFNLIRAELIRGNLTLNSHMMMVVVMIVCQTEAEILKFVGTIASFELKILQSVSFVSILHDNSLVFYHRKNDLDNFYFKVLIGKYIK